MKVTSQAITCFVVLSSSASACPFGNSGGALPNDALHRQGLRRRLSSNDRNVQRELQLQADCMTEDTYDSIFSEVEGISAAFGEDNIARGHFLGGIVRLAAHDFMDYDQSDTVAPMGADGCIDWQHKANTGLDTIWCEGCSLKQVYDDKYFDIMSRADFWVASANAVIKLSSNGELDLKDTFMWGRADADQCPDSGLRLPEAQQCSEVQEVFLNRLGLSWTDAVALIGGHTLGRGGFSGHDGIWVDTVEESVVFDKRYYEELLRRAWAPRNEGTDAQDWTWGNPINDGNPRFMLNTDMCLLFDIETTFPCCTRTDLFRVDGTNQCDNRNRVLSNTQCGMTSNEETFNAIIQFSGQRNDGGFVRNNGPFFTAFRIAWEIATKNGLDNLQELSLSCVLPAPEPTPLPTTLPTRLSTVPPTPKPTLTPMTSSPTASCFDVVSFTDNNGRTRDCMWVIQNNRCAPFAHLCPVSCGECKCLLTSRVCTSGGDCCSGKCSNGQCACLGKNERCTSNEQCCSSLCLVDGICAGKNTIFN